MDVSELKGSAGGECVRNERLERLMRKMGIDGKNVVDFVVGYDALRSSLILNLNECRRSLETLYRFKLHTVSLLDLQIQWKNVL